MWAQCDEHGNQYQLLEAIVDHKLDKNAIQQADGFVFVYSRLTHCSTLRDFN
jgi:hypothetical protein